MFLAGASRPISPKLRAYVGVEYLKIECASCDSEKYIPILPVPGTIAKDFFRISVRNSGVTPARKLKVTTSAVTTTWPNKLPDDFNFADGQKTTVPGPL